MSAHEALRNDIERLLVRELEYYGLDVLTSATAEFWANRIVHLVVLHGLLPETEER